MELVRHGLLTMMKRFSDAQCGFKAVSRPAAIKLLPLIENDHWFFDTELLVLAEKLGFKTLDLPLKWTDDGDSRVNVWRTVLEDIRGIRRLRRRLSTNFVGLHLNSLVDYPTQEPNRHQG